MIGRAISHYTLLGEIRRGGMGVVYRALDTRLKREVAIKFLPAALVSDEDRKRRFVQEAQAAAALQHPNIAVVHEIDEIDGITFIVMELVHGESLRDVMERGPLPLSRALPIARQIAEGLASAHEKGIVHRDVKPANVMVLEGDAIKIIDFGLAKLVEPIGDGGSFVETALRRETEAGTLLGTVSYMSPEQARGQNVDHRSDLFSLGTVLYEMTAGRDPFERATPADTVSAILNEEPARLSAIPGGVRAILERCLAKAPGDRYATASELAAALRSEEASLRTTSPRAGRFALAAFLVVALVAGTWWISTRRASSPEPAPEVLSVLIADFENRTGESVFDGAIEQALAISLEGAPFITAYDRARARQQVATLSPESEGKLDETMTRLVCRSQGIELALTGSVEPEGSGYRVQVSALDPVTAEILAEASENVADKARVLRAVDRLASDLRGDLGDLDPTSRWAFEEEVFTTASLEAMQAYSAGQDLLNSGEFEEAIRQYEKAVAADPDFGRAYSGLGVALFGMDRRNESRWHFEKALSLLHRMSDREKLRTRGVYYLFSMNYQEAIDEYEELVREFPSDTTAMVNLAVAHFYKRDFDKALDLGRRVATRDKSLLGRLNIAIYATYAGRLDAAVEEAQAVISENPAYQNAYVVLALAYVARGDSAEATNAYRRLEQLEERGASLAAMGLADLALYQGRRTEAQSLLTAAVERDVESGNNFAAAQKLSALAEIQLLDGEGGAARGTVQRALSLSEDIGTRFRAAMTHLKSGDRVRALELTGALASEEDPESKALAGVLRAEAALLDGDGKRAVSILPEARELADTWLGRFALGRAYLDSGAFVEANSELETCLRRRGEATALFLDDIPSFRVVPEVHYYLGRSHEGLGSKPGAAESYRTYLSIKENGEDTPTVQDAKRRLSSIR